jgi:hypothetical protein
MPENFSHPNITHVLFTLAAQMAISLVYVICGVQRGFDQDFLYFLRVPVLSSHSVTVPLTTPSPAHKRTITTPEMDHA